MRERLLEFFFAECVLPHHLFVHDEPRTDGVHLDARRTELASGCLGERFDARLRRRIRSTFWSAHDSCTRTDVDDVSTAVTDHVRRDRLYGEKDALQVELDGFIPS